MIRIDDDDNDDDEKDNDDYEDDYDDDNNDGNDDDNNDDDDDDEDDDDNDNDNFYLLPLSFDEINGLVGATILMVIINLGHLGLFFELMLEKKEELSDSERNGKN